MTPAAVDTIPQMVASGAARGGELTILQRDAEKSVTSSYEALNEDAGGVAATLLDRGFEPGDRVGLIGETSLDFVTAAIALWRAGATVVLLPERAHRSRAEWAASIATRVEMTEARAVVVPSNLDPSAELGAPAISLRDIPRGKPATADIDPDAIATIFFSSGTTANPKSIPMTHRNVAHQIRFRRQVTTASGPEHHLFWWSPLHTTMSFQKAMLDPLTQGVSVTYMEPRQLIAEPERWLREISRRRITHSGGLTFGFELVSRSLAAGPKEPLDLSSWVECGAMGEMVNPMIMERFFDLAEPFGLKRTAFVSTYATSETSVITTGRSRDGFRVDHLDPNDLAAGRATPTSGENRSSFVSNGTVVEGVELRLVDEHGEGVGERRIGNILVRSPAMMTNYLGLNDEIDWFATRDRGYMADGELFLIGRLDDLVIVRGVNLSTIAIESVVTDVLAQGSVACAFGVARGPSHEVVVVVGRTEDDPTSTDDIQGAVRRELWDRMGLSVLDVAVVPESAIPRASGKLERALLRDRYVEGRLR